MSRINTKEWKEFNLRDIGFLNFHGKRIKKSDRNDGNLIFITAGIENLGVSGTIGNNVEIWEYPITVDMFGNCFYHHCECYGDDNIYAFINNKLNKYQKLFLASCINEQINDLFSYKNQFRQEHANQLTIKLPVDSDGNPDRDYMENYMKNLENRCKNILEELKETKNISKKNLNTILWKEFKIGDLFDISSPSARSQNNYEEGEIPFVASGDVNNGILKYCEPKKDEKLDEGKCITVSPVDGSSFYQEGDFLGRGGAGSSIMILRNENLNKYCGLFIAGIIRKCCNFTYNDMGNREKLKNLIVKFPVDSEGNPNRDFMENYIKNIMEKNREKLKCLD